MAVFYLIDSGYDDGPEPAIHYLLLGNIVMKIL